MLQPKKCLILRFSSIGDIVLTTPVIEALKKTYPDCEIHYLTLEEFIPILGGNPYLDRIIPFSRKANRSSLRHLTSMLRLAQYDLFLDLHNSLRTRYIRWRLSDRKWVVYRKPRWDRFLLFYLHINHFAAHFDISASYAELIDGALVSGSELIPRIYISEEEKIRSRALLLSAGVGPEFIAVLPGAAWKTKTWFVDRYAEVISSLTANDGIQTVILGGADDDICDSISAAVPSAVNLKGKTKLRTSLAILSLAKVALGGDTGLVHGAEAVGTPVVMIMGPTSRETGARVRDSRSIELSAKPWCRPCSKNGSRPCYRQQQFCMTEITSGKVLNSVANLWAEA